MSFRVAVHEAGHAMIALAAGLPVGVVTIAPDADSVGHVDIVHDEPAQPRPLLTDEQRTAIKTFEAVYAIAGEVAEDLAFGGATAGCEDDQQRTSAAVETVDDLTGAPPWHWRHTIREAARSYLTANWEAATRLALVLMSEKTLSGQRVRGVAGEVPALDLRRVTGAVVWAARMAARERRSMLKTGEPQT